MTTIGTNIYVANYPNTSISEYTFDGATDKQPAHFRGLALPPIGMAADGYLFLCGSIELCRPRYQSVYRCWCRRSLDHSWRANNLAINGTNLFASHAHRHHRIHNFWWRCK